MIHGHEVIALVADAQPPFTLTTLKDAASARWGAQARFHTCSADDLSLAQLLDFLLERAKLVVSADGALSVVAGNVCSHGD